jgi:uncharacterized membrane protein (UPF0127 family)
MVINMENNDTPMTATLEVKYDPELNDYFLELPPDMLARLGWQVGDELIWTQIDKSTWSLGKKNQPTGEES